ncbi:MAG: hypothetical protein JW697_04775 [Kosmotogaceae bacterium]|nr:hypothetical protein [Kosmotogaceae bacterium]
MKRITLITSCMAILLMLLSGCFFIDPMVKVSLLVSNFESYWEDENAVGLAGLYTNPALINTAVKSYSQIIDAYSSRFEGRDVIFFNRGDVEVDFNVGVTEATVQFSAVIDWTSGPDDYRTYSWTVKKISGNWFISRSNEY